MTDTNGNGNIRQQVGEILGTVRLLERLVLERQTEAREESQLFRAELRSVQEERRRDELSIARLALQTADLTIKLVALQTPVDELMNAKRRFVAITAFVGSVILVLWAVTEPLRTWAANKVFGPH